MFTRLGQPTLLCCDAVCGGGVWEGTVPLVWLSAGFQSLPLLPTIKLSPSGADSHVGGFVCILGPCRSLRRTLLWGWEFFPLPPQTPQVFSFRGVEALFPRTGTLGCAVYLAPQFFLPVYLHSNVGPTTSHRLSLPDATLLWVLSAQLPLSAPPTGLDECFFNSLVVGLPYSLIFCQLVVFVFKFVAVLLLVVQGGAVCLCLHLGWKSRI